MGLTDWGWEMELKYWGLGSKAIIDWGWVQCG